MSLKRVHARPWPAKKGVNALWRRATAKCGAGLPWGHEPRISLRSSRLRRTEQATPDRMHGGRRLPSSRCECDLIETSGKITETGRRETPCGDCFRVAPGHKVLGKIVGRRGVGGHARRRTRDRGRPGDG